MSEPIAETLTPRKERLIYIVLGVAMLTGPHFFGDTIAGWGLFVAGAFDLLFQL